MTDRIVRARDFIFRNARLLERQLFAFHFDGGSADAVIAALAAYQNADGGFGHALEPDKRTPHSQPQDAEIALHVLDAVGHLPKGVIQRLCDWLQSVTTEEDGVPFSLPSVNDFPHAPWWGCEPNPPANSNPTAAIVGLLDKHGIVHPWVQPAAEFCWAKAEGVESAQFHDLAPLILFLEHAFDRARAERALARIGDLIAQPGAVELDPAAQGYVKKPLDWAPTPASFARKLFSDDIIAQHLAWLAGQQQEDGGWPISWETVSPGVTLEWRGAGDDRCAEDAGSVWRLASALDLSAAAGRMSASCQ